MSTEPAAEPGGADLSVGAVVLHHRFWPGLRATLDALLGQSVPPQVVLVVDNGSGEELTDQIKDSYPEIELVRAPENLGYAAGMNLGIRHLHPAGVAAILLLTHECVMEPGCLQHLRDRMAKNPRLGAAGPLLRLLGRPDTVWSAGGTVDPRTGLPGHRGAGEGVAAWVHRPPASVSWLDGACLLIRTDAASGAGLLEERYFLYYEDAEFAARLRREGWQIECVPQAVAAQEPSKVPVYLSVRNRLGFLADTASRSQLAAEVGRLALNLGRDFVRPRSAPARADLAERGRALFDFLRGRWGPPPW